MRDFIDRVTARALGSESMLTPRLPSLFEPQRSPAAGLQEEVSETVAATPRPSMSIERTPPTARETPVSLSKAIAREAPTPRQPAVPEPRAAIRRGMDIAPTPVTSPIRSNSSAPSESRPASSRLTPAQLLEQALPPARVQQEVLRDVLPATEPRTIPAEGSLLAPAQAVFRTPPASPTAAAARSQGPRDERAMQPGPAHEPVVHVSIGRLEVRAAPAPAKLAHRHEAPRTSPLDDYLRERGKASP